MDSAMCSSSGDLLELRAQELLDAPELSTSALLQALCAVRAAYQSEHPLSSLDFLVDASVYQLPFQVSTPREQCTAANKPFQNLRVFAPRGFFAGSGTLYPHYTCEVELDIGSLLVYRSQQMRQQASLGVRALSFVFSHLLGSTSPELSHVFERYAACFALQSQSPNWYHDLKQLHLDGSFTSEALEFFPEDLRLRATVRQISMFSNGFYITDLGTACPGGRFTYRASAKK